MISSMLLIHYVIVIVVVRGEMMILTCLIRHGLNLINLLCGMVVASSITKLLGGEIIIKFIVITLLSRDLVVNLMITLTLLSFQLNINLHSSLLPFIVY
jgi:hypothetical protein